MVVLHWSCFSVEERYARHICMILNVDLFPDMVLPLYFSIARSLCVPLLHHNRSVCWLQATMPQAQSITAPAK